MNKYVWRQIALADAAEIVEMHAAEKRIDPRVHGVDQATIEHTLERVLSAPHTAGTVVLTKSGQLIGIALMLLLPSDDQITVQCIGHVHIDFRRQGLGGELFEWIVAQAHENYRKLGTESRLWLRTSCRDFMTDRIALFESQGLTPARYSVQMRCEIDSVEFEHKLPEAFQIRQWSEDQDDQLRQAFNLAFQEHWGVRQLEPEDWRQWLVSGPHFRPDLTYLVYAEEQLIGFCIAEHHVEKNKQSGLNEVWLEIIGVHPDWRGRGIASGLIAYALKNYQEQGFTHAGLDVDTQNVTQALSLYKKLGFVEVQREITFGKEL